MDWTKAKTILILALVVTNLVLLGALFHREMQQDQMSGVTMEEILAGSNIYIETELPENYPMRLPVLYVSPVTPDEARMQEALASQTMLSGKNRSNEKTLQAVERVLMDSGLMFSGAVLEEAPRRLENGEIIVCYRNVVNGIPLEPVEKNRIECIVRNTEVAEIRTEWYNVTEVHRKKGELREPLEALMELLAAKQEEDVFHVTNVELVYWINPEGYNETPFFPASDTALPAWKIVYNEGQVRYLLAYHT